jgi:DNA repair protein RadA/Sms
MQNRGLVEITDPASVFMIQRAGSLPSGIAAAPVWEGSRILVVEIQALTVPAKSGVSRVFSDRIDSQKVARVAAVLEKHIGIRFSDQDIYVNVAGGLKIRDVGVELPLAMALYSARTGLPVPSHAIVTGEVSLAGEIRPVGQLKRRLRAAEALGFTKGIGPEVVRQGEDAADAVHVGTVRECVRELWGKVPGTGSSTASDTPPG